MVTIYHPVLDVERVVSEQVADVMVARAGWWRGPSPHTEVPEVFSVSDEQEHAVAPQSPDAANPGPESETNEPESPPTDGGE